eukprot:3711810-Amphidinium_carterae.1
MSHACATRQQPKYEIKTKDGLNDVQNAKTTYKLNVFRVYQAFKLPCAQDSLPVSLSKRSFVDDGAVLEVGTRLGDFVHCVTTLRPSCDTFFEFENRDGERRKYARPTRLKYSGS